MTKAELVAAMADKAGLNKVQAKEALDAFMLLSRLEGILPAIESAHALARLPEVTREVGKGGIVVLNLSGRGDKDVATVAAHLGRTI